MSSDVLSYQFISTIEKVKEDSYFQPGLQPETWVLSAKPKAFWELAKGEQQVPGESQWIN